IPASSPLTELPTAVPFVTTLPQSIASFKEEAEKASEVIRGLVVRLMGTLDNDLCLAVLHVTARAFPSNFNALVGLWEEALRSYFVQAKFAEQLTMATNALTIPEVDNVTSLLTPCAETKCPLSMRIVLEREKQEWINLP